MTAGAYRPPLYRLTDAELEHYARHGTPQERHLARTILAGRELQQRAGTTNGGRTMTYDGYAKLHPVGIQVRADTLEAVAGYDDAAMRRELAFALGTLDLEDARTIRWTAALLARQLDELEAGE